MSSSGNHSAMCDIPDHELRARARALVWHRTNITYILLQFNTSSITLLFL